MPPPNDPQRDFAAALLDPGLPPPEGLTGPDGEPSADRFAVYRNNVAVGLIDALADAFPAVRRIVGDEFFRAMARIHALAEPPASPILLDYGAKFAEFIAGFPPATGLPYLADVARIERAWREAYYAAEAEPIDPAALAGLDPNDLPGLGLTVHPSLRLVRSQFPALTIWAMNVGDGEATSVDLTGSGEDVLIVRPHAVVEARSLPEGGLEFIEALRGGETVLGAAAGAQRGCALFDIAANIAGLLEARAIIGLTRGERLSTPVEQGS